MSDAALPRIALVGIGCRLPGAADADALWRLVRAGADAFTTLGESELLAAGVPRATLDDPRYVRRTPLLDRIADFDAGFFGLSAEQADRLDPQHRLFFECAWEALEDAGVPPECVGGAVGVFGGCSVSSYLLFNLLAAMQPGASAQTLLTMIGNEKDYLPTHLSYLLGLTGPSVGVQTACSTSLAAVHLACQSLAAGECDLALAGGATVCVPHHVGYRYEEGSILSPSGHCRSFDAAADGTVFGSGAAVVALRRLDDALADGDPVHAVILGSALNHDGNRKAGFTAPSVDGQAAVIAEALAVAGADPATIGLVEAHGTGTPIGDPIEAKALAEVFRGGAPGSLALSCVKANLGHLEAAAGVAGLIAAAMALRHAELPPIAHYAKPNPLLRLEETPLAIGRTARRWPATLRRAGVSSFGLSGTNVHVVLEQAPDAATTARSTNEPKTCVLAVSARSEGALEQARRELVAALDDAIDLAAAARTATFGRRAFEHRLAVAAASPAEARDKLSRAAPVLVASRPCLAIRYADPKAPAAPLRSTPGTEAQAALAARLAALGIAAQPGEPTAILAIDGARETSSADAGTRIALAAPAGEAEFMAALAALHAHGFVPDWRAILGTGPRARLPRYPFQRQRHWREPVANDARFPGEAVATPLAACLRRTTLRPGALRWLDDHQVDGRPVLPAAGYAALALATGVPGLSGLAIAQALPVAADGTLVTATRDEAGAIRIHAQRDGDWTLLATATGGSAEADLGGFDLAAAQARCHETVDAAALHARMAAGGIALGPSLRRFARLQRGPGEALARLVAADDLAGDALRVHPAVLDALFQALAAAVPDGVAAHLPVALDALGLAPAADTAQAAWCHARLRPTAPGSGTIVGDLALLAEDGRVLLRAEGLACRPAHAAGSFLRHVYLPAWEARKDAVVTIAPEAPPRHGVDLSAHAAALPALDRLCAAWVVRALVTLGARFEPGTTAQLARDVVPRHARLVPRLWRMLEEDGVVDGAHRVLRAPEHEPERLHAQLAATHPELATELALLARCGRELAAVLTGTADPLALLFARASGAGAPAVYAESRYATALNALALDAVQPLAQSGLALRVLEIGGGTGGTTAHLLPALAPVAADYLFTDLSPAFLASAQERFGAHACLRTARLDIERDPAAQGVGAASCHLVVAANVLHATRDLSAAVAHARRALVPGGWLVLVEGLRPSRWLDLTFALTEGWWSATDRALRPDYPLLDGEGWRRLLAAQGFEAVHVATPGDGPLADQGVIVARRTPAAERKPALLRDALEADDPAAAVLARLKVLPEAAPRLLVATRRAQRVRAWEAPDAAQAAVAGLVRAAALERPATAMRTVDLDPLADDADRVLALEAALDDGETDVAWRDGVRHVLRLHRPDTPAAPARFRLVADASSFALEPRERRAPGAGEVEIAVHAAGLNFKDVLAQMGVVAGAGGLAPGGECAGVVTALGAGVTGFAPGDRVVALAGGSFASHVVVPALRVAAIPPQLTLDQAAALPISGMTALHALRECAKLGAGERILIHAATGGVGQHALALARAAGAEVFATAGSAAKRAWLRRQGVRHVFDSRCAAFADEVRAATAGMGVDVVLNCLAGEAIAAGLGLLRAGGRFVELGRAGTWSADAVAAAYPGVAYHVVELDRIGDAQGGRLLQATLAAAVAGALATPPLTRFPLAQAAAAYAHMREARHIGRIVLTRPRPLAFDAQRSVLVTGGLGGLGLALAGWAIAQGARHLVLAGRTPPAPSAEERLAALRAQGARVEVETLDVSDEAAVARLAATFGQARPRLSLVFHAAGTLDDAPLAAQDAARLARVRAAKLDGARHLARHCRDLDAFVLFGSAAGLLGSAGQANHAAAGAAMDAYAQALHARGVPAVTIDWGPWAEIGAAARRGVAARLAQSGMGELAPAEGFAILAWAIEQGIDRAAALPIDWAVFGAGDAPLPPLFASVAARAKIPAAASAPAGGAAAPGPGTATATPVATLAATLATLTPARRLEWLEARVAQEAARLIGRTAAIPPDQALTELGLDSLQAIELRNRLGALAGAALPATLVFDYPTVRALAKHLLGIAQPAEESAVPSAPVRAPRPPAASDPAGESAPDDGDFDRFLRELESRHLPP